MEIAVFQVSRYEDYRMDRGLKCEKVCSPGASSLHPYFSFGGCSTLSSLLSPGALRLSAHVNSSQGLCCWSSLSSRLRRIQEETARDFHCFSLKYQSDMVHIRPNYRLSHHQQTQSSVLIIWTYQNVEVKVLLLSPGTDATARYDAAYESDKPALVWAVTAHDMGTQMREGFDVFSSNTSSRWMNLRQSHKSLNGPAEG